MSEREVHMAHCGSLNDGVCKYGDEDCPAANAMTTDESEAVERVRKALTVRRGEPGAKYLALPIADLRTLLRLAEQGASDDLSRD